MRNDLTLDSLELFLEQFGKALAKETKVYVSGGASAVKMGWRDSSRDIDLKIIPDGEAYDHIAQLKEKLKINIELAAPDDFIPAVPGWEARSMLIGHYGVVSFYHYDFYTQALSKIERGFEQDLADVGEMVLRDLIEPKKLEESFETISSKLIRYPAIDPNSFKKSLEKFLKSL